MIKIPPKCYMCKHQIMINVEPSICLAFPRGIPYDIIYRNVAHNKPVRGQKNKLVFTELNK